VVTNYSRRFYTDSQATVRLGGVSGKPFGAPLDHAEDPSPREAIGSGARADTIAVVLLVLAGLVILGIGVKMYDLHRRRQAEAILLQSQLSDALMREQLLIGLPITPTAHAPFWRRSPVIIEVAGRVPSPQARETALRIVRAEAARIRSDIQIEDHLAIVPPQAA
jgi:hypothetical protein